MAPASVLVIGAGELGKAVLRSLAAHSIRFSVKIAVLLRRSTINSNESPKQKDVDDLKALGIELVEGDVVDDSEQQLANTFSKFHTIINCSGMFLPAGTQKRVAEAAVASSCSRYFPWQFGVDYDAIGPNSSQDLFTEQLDVRAILRGQSKVRINSSDSKAHVQANRECTRVLSLSRRECFSHSYLSPPLALLMMRGML